MNAAPEPSSEDDRLKRRLDMLDALAAVGMKVAEAVGRMADEGAGTASELSLAYDRVSRAMRLNLMLQDRMVGDAADRVVQARKAVEEDRKLQAARRKTTIGRVVFVTAAETYGEKQADLIYGFKSECLERLDDENLYGDLLDRPISEIVARICEDLDLDPDWSKLACDLWAQQEMDGPQPGWPLKALLDEEEKDGEEAFIEGAAADSPLISPTRSVAGGGPIAEPSEERWVEGAGLTLDRSAGPLPDSS